MAVDKFKKEHFVNDLGREGNKERQIRGGKLKGWWWGGSKNVKKKEKKTCSQSNLSIKELFLRFLKKIRLKNILLFK